MHEKRMNILSFVRGRDGNLIGSGHFKWFDNHFLKGKVLLPEKTGCKPIEGSVWSVTIGKELPNAIFCKAEEEITLENIENYVRPLRKAHTLVYQAYHLKKEVALPIMLDITSEKIIGISYFENIPYKTTLSLIKPGCKEKLKLKGLELTESQEKLIDTILESKYQMTELSATRKLDLLKSFEEFKVEREKVLLNVDDNPALKEAFHYTIQQHKTSRNTPLYTVRFFLLEEFLSRVRQQMGLQIPLSIDPEDYPLPYRNELEDYISGRRPDYPQTKQAWDSLKELEKELVDFYFTIPADAINEIVEQTRDGVLLTRMSELVLRFKDLQENWKGQLFGQDYDKFTTKQEYLNKSTKTLLEEIEETTGLSYTDYWNNVYEIVEGHKIILLRPNKIILYEDPKIGLILCPHQEFNSERGSGGLYQVERVSLPVHQYDSRNTTTVTQKYVIYRILDDPDSLTPNDYCYADKSRSLFARKRGESFFIRLDHFRTLEGLKGYIEAMGERMPYPYTGQV